MNLTERIKRDPFGAAALFVVLFGLALLLGLGWLRPSVTVTVAQPSPATSPAIVLQLQESEGATAKVLDAPVQQATPATLAAAGDTTPVTIRPIIVAVIVPTRTTSADSAVTVRPQRPRTVLASPPTAPSPSGVTQTALAPTTAPRRSTTTSVASTTSTATTTTTDPETLGGASDDAITTTTNATTTTGTSAVTTTTEPASTTSTEVATTEPPTDPTTSTTAPPPADGLVTGLLTDLLGTTTTTWFPSCATAQLAGAAPLLPTDAGFTFALDTSNGALADGIACELSA